MRFKIISMEVNITSILDVIEKIKVWTRDESGRYVCVSNVHMCMEVYDSKKYAEVVNNADLTVADGKPIYWAQVLTGHKNAQQIRGEDLTLALCQQAEKIDQSIGFYGATETTLNHLEKALLTRFPKIKIVYCYSPPFRPLSDEEDEKVIDEINKSEVQILFVGLGCPKQEIWMVEHKSKVSCTMLGVGAAFDFISGNKKMHLLFYKSWDLNGFID